MFLLRPGYEAIEAMLPAFEEETGIKINIIKHPYENALGEQVRDFVAGGDLDIALIDLVWIGNFAENDWILPLADVQANFPDAVDPECWKRPASTVRRKHGKSSRTPMARP